MTRLPVCWLGTGETLLLLNKSATGTSSSVSTPPNISTNWFSTFLLLSSTLSTSTPWISSRAVTLSTSSAIRLMRLARLLLFLTAWSTSCLPSLSARPSRTSAAAAMQPNFTLLFSTFSRYFLSFSCFSTIVSAKLVLKGSSSSGFSVGLSGITFSLMSPLTMTSTKAVLKKSSSSSSSEDSLSDSRSAWPSGLSGESVVS